ncbi:hypothetical protein T08_1020 [Trichinella sp. T8]|nr:hypothetical protein T08_1020 [Trichinella sp. T8]
MPYSGQAAKCLTPLDYSIPQIYNFRVRVALVKQSSSLVVLICNTDGPFTVPMVLENTLAYFQSVYRTKSHHLGQSGPVILVPSQFYGEFLPNTGMISIAYKRRTTNIYHFYLYTPLMPYNPTQCLNAAWNNITESLLIYMLNYYLHESGHSVLPDISRPVDPSGVSVWNRGTGAACVWNVLLSRYHYCYGVEHHKQKEPCTEVVDPQIHTY